MFTSIEQFKFLWKDEISLTLKLMNTLTDESLNQKVYNDGRTLAYLAWHIVLTISEMCGRAGIKIEELDYDSDAPDKAVDIANSYERISTYLYDEIGNQWTSDMLSEEIKMYNENWTRGIVLDSLVRHQIHHRGQMTVLMRQAGLKVPGIYGPAKEEWAAFGMEPLK